MRIAGSCGGGMPVTAGRWRRCLSSAEAAARPIRCQAPPPRSSPSTRPRPGRGGDIPALPRLSDAVRGRRPLVCATNGRQPSAGQGDHSGQHQVAGYGSGATGERRSGGDWAATEAGGGAGEGHDYLSELGRAQDYNINVDHGQNWQQIDYLFAGEKLGHKADIADGSLRKYDVRSLSNLSGDYYIAPKFLEAVAVHIAKNILSDQGVLDARTPLILGIWGGKGQGKSFQTELAFKKLGVVPIIMSAGELEHEWAGTPGQLIRERYLRASAVIKNEGKLSCLMINDLDAGLGRFGDTQVTVNNQIVVGTLMNICDDPNMISLGEDWREDSRVHRVPIVVTGNDFSRLYAPLIRDGRMQKFYWSPTRTDILNILHAMYKEDNLTVEDMKALLDAFPGQPLDFFGAIRASVYDSRIRDWIHGDVMQGKAHEDWDEEGIRELRRRLMFKERLPDVQSVVVTLSMLLGEGRRLVSEQEHVMTNNLAEEYMKDLKKEREMAKVMVPLSQPKPSAPPPPAPSAEVTLAFKKARESLVAAGFQEVQRPKVEEEETEEVEDSPWPVMESREARALMDGEGYVYVDVRPSKDFERDSYKMALSIPAVKVSGFGATAQVEQLDSFVPSVQERFPDPEQAKLVVVGGDNGEYADTAIASLQGQGFTNVVEVRGGFAEWTKAYRPNGEPRAQSGGWMSAEGREELFGTGG